MLLVLIGIVFLRQELKIAEILNTDFSSAKMLDFQLQLAWTFIFLGLILLFLPLLTTFLGRQIWYLLATIKLIFAGRMLFLFHSKFIQFLQAK